MKNISESSFDRLNPIKSKEIDWWDEMCKQHGAENHWKKKPKAKKEEDKKDEKKDES